MFKKGCSKKKIIIIACIAAVVILAVAGIILWKMGVFKSKAHSPVTGTAMETEIITVDCANIDIPVYNEADAYKALNSVSALFGFENASDVLTTKSVDNVDGDTYYRFAQQYKGIPVEGKTIVLSAGDDGKVFHISGNYVDIDDSLSVPPKLNADKAKSQVEKQIKSEIPNGLSVSAPKLKIFCGAESNTLTWETTACGYDKDDVFVSWSVYADANTGDVIYKTSNIDYNQVTKTETGHNNGQQTITVEEKEVNGKKQYSLYDEKRGISVYKPIDKYYWYQDGKAELITYNEGEAADESAVDALANMSKVYDYFEKLKWVGIDKFDGKIPVYVHAEDMNMSDGNSTNRRIWGIENGNAFRYREGNYHGFAFTVTKSGFGEHSTNLDTVAHEYTHAVSGDIADLQGALDTNITGAVNEAYSDIFGELIEDAYYGPGTDWVHGDRHIKSPDGKVYFSYYDKNFVIKDAYDCYRLSTIISHAAYLMYKGAKGDGSAINNTETLAKLWYDSLYMLNSNSDFENCRYAVETSAQRLLNRGLLTPEQVEGVSAAFNEVGIGEEIPCMQLAPNSTLTVYDVYNNEYYNYHYKVELVEKKNVNVLGKASEISTSTVEEGDVTEKKEIKLPIKTTSKYSRYIITISDLAEDPGSTQKITVVVPYNAKNNNLKIYTDFVDENIKKAYNAYCAKIAESSGLQYALHDINNDSIPELIIEEESSKVGFPGTFEYYIYTYTNDINCIGQFYSASLFYDANGRIVTRLFGTGRVEYQYISADLKETNDYIQHWYYDPYAINKENTAYSEKNGAQIDDEMFFSMEKSLIELQFFAMNNLPSLDQMM